MQEGNEKINYVEIELNEEYRQEKLIHVKVKQVSFKTYRWSKTKFFPLKKPPSGNCSKYLCIPPNN